MEQILNKLSEIEITAQRSGIDHVVRHGVDRLHPGCVNIERDQVGAGTGLHKPAVLTTLRKRTVACRDGNELLSGKRDRIRIACALHERQKIHILEHIMVVVAGYPIGAETQHDARLFHGLDVSDTTAELRIRSGIAGDEHSFVRQDRAVFIGEPHAVIGRSRHVEQSQVS